MYGSVLFPCFLIKQSRVAVLLDPIGRRVSLLQTHFCLLTLGLSAFSARGEITHSFLISLSELNPYLCSLIHSVACQDDDKQAHGRAA